jgi:prepilin-type N-terminal cleavage/methylation domain-containing protein/prepilin-type processing-associated H-X9-DG protein
MTRLRTSGDIDEAILISCKSDLGHQHAGGRAVCEFKKSNLRRGFTLVELLVVIAIVGALIAFLLPAVQAAREAARRVACVANLKQLGLACLNYDVSQGSFPPGAVGPLTPAFPQYAKLKHHGLGTFLLPYLEQQPLYDRYDWNASWFDPPNQTAVNTQLNVWQCPSADANRVEDGSLPAVVPPPPDPFNGTAACGDYAGSGVVDAGLVTARVIETPRGSRDDRGNYEGVFPINHTRRLQQILDGQSNTILIGECAGRPQLWHRRAEVPNLLLTGGPWASRGLLWGRGATADGSEFYGTCAINCTNDREVYGFHPGGANILFADGHVRFVKETINIQVYVRLVTRDGGEIISANDF